MSKIDDATQSPENCWTEVARSHLQGRIIESVRYLDLEEAEEMCWDSRPVVIELDDGALLYPSCDDEGNNGGALFGQSPGGEPWILPVL